jgi:hypothetical protein
MTKVFKKNAGVIAVASSAGTTGYETAKDAVKDSLFV